MPWPKLGQRIRIVKGRLKGYGGEVLAVNAPMLPDEPTNGSLAFEDEEGRIRHLAGTRINDLVIEDDAER